MPLALAVNPLQPYRVPLEGGRRLEEVVKRNRGAKAGAEIRARDGCPKPDRCACGQSDPNASTVAGYEPRDARQRAWSDFSAGPKIRRRRQPCQRVPAIGDGGDPRRADLIFLWRSAAG